MSPSREPPLGFCRTYRSEFFRLDLYEMRILFKNIKQLLQIRETEVRKVSGEEMGVLPYIENAFLLTENEHIVDFGSMDAISETDADLTVDASGGLTGNDATLLSAARPWSSDRRDCASTA